MCVLDSYEDADVDCDVCDGDDCGCGGGDVYDDAGVLKMVMLMMAMVMMMQMMIIVMVVSTRVRLIIVVVRMRLCAIVVVMRCCVR